MFLRSTAYAPLARTQGRVSRRRQQEHRPGAPDPAVEWFLGGEEERRRHVAEAEVVALAGE